jgi:hypothetical protein
MAEIGINTKEIIEYMKNSERNENKWNY